MKFLAHINNLERSINWWITDHPWLTTLYTLLAAALFIFTWHTVPWLCIAFFSIYFVVVISIMLGSATYLVASKYQPEFCDKCGHVLPEKRPNGF